MTITPDFPTKEVLMEARRIEIVVELLKVRRCRLTLG